jgi:hypothetical protein
MGLWRPLWDFHRLLDSSMRGRGLHPGGRPKDGEQDVETWAAGHEYPLSHSCNNLAMYS